MTHTHAHLREETGSEMVLGRGLHLQTYWCQELMGSLKADWDVFITTLVKTEGVEIRTFPLIQGEVNCKWAGISPINTWAPSWRCWSVNPKPPSAEHKHTSDSLRHRTSAGNSPQSRRTAQLHCLYWISVFLCWIWTHSVRWKGIFPSSGFLKAARPRHPHFPQTLGSLPVMTSQTPLAPLLRACLASTADGDQKTRRIGTNAWSQHSRKTVCCVHLRKRPSQMTTILLSNTLTVKNCSV